MPDRVTVGLENFTIGNMIKFIPLLVALISPLSTANAASPLAASAQATFSYANPFDALPTDGQTKRFHSDDTHLLLVESVRLFSTSPTGSQIRTYRVVWNGARGEYREVKNEVRHNRSIRTNLVDCGSRKISPQEIVQFTDGRKTHYLPPNFKNPKFYEYNSHADALIDFVCASFLKQ